MESTYSQPFKKAIGEGGAAGIMYACNEVINMHRYMIRTDT